MFTLEFIKPELIFLWLPELCQCCTIITAVAGGAGHAPGSHSCSVGCPGHSLPWTLTALELWLPELSPSNPCWGAPAASDLQLSALLVKNNNYESLITLCLSPVSLLSITLKCSWNRIISITLWHGSLVLFLKAEDLSVCYLLLCVMGEDFLLFLALWCFCQAEVSAVSHSSVGIGFSSDLPQ